jgi:hypothetical protein
VLQSLPQVRVVLQHEVAAEFIEVGDDLLKVELLHVAQPLRVTQGQSRDQGVEVGCREGRRAAAAAEADQVLGDGLAADEGGDNELCRSGAGQRRAAEVSAGAGVVDAVEPRIRELMAAYPTMPTTVIAERIGWTRSIRTLSGRVAQLRPAICHRIRPAAPVMRRAR